MRCVLPCFGDAFPPPSCPPCPPPCPPCPPPCPLLHFPACDWPGPPSSAITGHGDWCTKLCPGITNHQATLLLFQGAALLCSLPCLKCPTAPPMPSMPCGASHPSCGLHLSTPACLPLPAPVLPAVALHRPAITSCCHHILVAVNPATSAQACQVPHAHEARQPSL